MKSDDLKLINYKNFTLVVGVFAFCKSPPLFSLTEGGLRSGPVKTLRNLSPYSIRGRV